MFLQRSFSNSPSSLFISREMTKVLLFIGGINSKAIVLKQKLVTCVEMLIDVTSKYNLSGTFATSLLGISKIKSTCSTSRCDVSIPIKLRKSGEHLTNISRKFACLCFPKNLNVKVNTSCKATKNFP